MLFLQTFIGFRRMHELYIRQLVYLGVLKLLLLNITISKGKIPLRIRHRLSEDTSLSLRFHKQLVRLLIDATELALPCTLTPLLLIHLRNGLIIKIE
jgi:hypothetical protein